jgi:hypothetical protein
VIVAVVRSPWVVALVVRDDAPDTIVLEGQPHTRYDIRDGGVPIGVAYIAREHALTLELHRRIVGQLLSVAEERRLAAYVAVDS